MLIQSLCFLYILSFISSQNLDYPAIFNIRHRRSRSRFFRNSLHTEFHGNTTLLKENVDPSSELFPSISELGYDQKFESSTEKIHWEKIIDVRNETTSDKNKIRKISLNSHPRNNSWDNVDKSMLFIGERALNHVEQKKKNKTEDEVTKGTLDVDLDVDIEDNDLIISTTDKSLENIKPGHVDIVTRFLRIVESQHLLGENCTAGTDLNLGEGVVDRYAQERFRVEADVAVNRANMLTRIWKYAGKEVLHSEYLLHASVFSMVEFDDDIFAAGNCYDQHQYKDYLLFCPYAYRLPDGTILVKDLAVEYNYMSNTSEWFYIARKNAEKVIKNFNQFSRGKLSHHRTVFCRSL
ncbi:hypothetical protein HHI36_014403 [Cryptolaemus montrouzieri]|uniref:Uncharacterized protein n=1 Tax=Cryptolaemus montrouzieri TaxID=559131 RepID=A0ABD2N2F8_9CUCU